MVADTNEHRSLHDELIELFRNAKLPSSPAVATRILELINDPNSSARGFAKVIESDPALAARLLTMSNSARYAQRRAVTSIQRAVTVVGLRQLRIVALGFELVSHIDRVGDASFDLPSFWQRSVLRACLAREIATRCVAPMAQEAFLVGLLQDCGIPLLAQVLGGEYADAYREHRGSPASFLVAERKRFRFDHTAAIQALATMWGLPAIIIEALAGHHERVDVGTGTPDELRLRAVIYVTTSVGFGGASGRAVDPSLRRYARGTLGLTDDDIADAIAASEAAFAEMAGLFDAGTIRRQDVAGLLQAANRLLLDQAQDSEHRVEEVEHERDHILDQQETLRNALGQYREQAARDPLTGLLNRRALLDSTVECLRRADASGEGIAVYFLDLDDFKRMNDDHGHSAGDAVLRGWANAIRASLGEGSFAGRYGGEEFIVVHAGVSEDQARMLGTRLLECTRRVRPADVELTAPVTCSIGGIWCHRTRVTSAESLFAAADELMYVAKKGGKNRVTFRALKAVAGAVEAPEATPDPEAAPGPASIRLIAPDQVDEFRAAADRLGRTVRPVAEGHRKQPRPTMFTPCILGCFNTSTLGMTREEAYIRNVTVGGVGLLTGRPLLRGDVVEVSLTVEDQTMHLAGLVSFCRLIEGSIHEIGVQVVQSGNEPILVGEHAEAMRGLGWVADALDRRAAADLPDRRSA